jgi:glycosyltransferase involved in cell wall biosynthesis
MKNRTVGIITIPISKSGLTPLSNLVDIICSLSPAVFLITGDAGYQFYKNDNRLTSFKIFHSNSTFFLLRIFNYMIIQVTISFFIVTTRKKVDCFIFFVGGDTLALPMITARILKKKVFILFAGSIIKTLESKKDPLGYGLKMLRYITCSFAHTLIVYAEGLIKDYSLERWTRKITIAYNHFIVFDRFRIEKEYPVREFIVGYVGRFDEEKGIMHLLHAVPDIVKNNPDVSFLFIGDGEQRNVIEHYITDKGMRDTIILSGWIAHELIADYLNRMKLLVIPSYTEGLPNVMIEAMACGTPVLATPVGAIPSIIRDEETGFIMENNTPACIAANVVRALSYPLMETIVENAKMRVEKDFTFESAVTRMKDVLDEN